MKTRCLLILSICISLITILKSVSAECGDGICIGGPGMCPPTPCLTLTSADNIVIDVLGAGAVIGTWFFIFRRFKDK